MGSTTRTSILLLLVLLAGDSSTLECFACRSDLPIGGITIASDIRARLKDFDVCSRFDGSSRFLQQCQPSDRGCMKAVDPTNPKNQMRMCFPIARDECIKTACYCTADRCNRESEAIRSSYSSSTSTGGQTLLAPILQLMMLATGTSLLLMAIQF